MAMRTQHHGLSQVGGYQDSPVGGPFGGHATLLTNLFLVWKLDESSDGSGAVTRNDSLGTNHLTDNNTTPSAAGMDGNAASFTAANSEYLRIAALTFDWTADWSISLWLAPTFVAGKVLMCGGSTMFRLYQSAANQLSAEWNGANTITKGSGVTDGQWRHLIAIHNNTEGKGHFYVDGVEVGTGTATNPGVQNGNFVLGAGAAGGTPGTALMDEVLLASRVWTAGEIADLWNGGAGLFY